MTTNTPYNRSNKNHDRGMLCQSHAKFAAKRSQARESDFVPVPAGTRRLRQGARRCQRYLVAPNAGRTLPLSTALVRNVRSNDNIVPWLVATRAGVRLLGKSGLCKPAVIVASNIIENLPPCGGAPNTVPKRVMWLMSKSMDAQIKKWPTGSVSIVVKSLPSRSAGLRRQRILANTVPEIAGIKSSGPGEALLVGQSGLSGEKGSAFLLIHSAISMNTTRIARNLSGSIAWLWSGCWAALSKKEKRSITAMVSGATMSPRI